MNQKNKKKETKTLPAAKLPIATPKKNDFRETVQWRIFRIMAEFVDGFQFLGNLKKTVSVFGSTRITPDHPQYKEAKKLSYLLGKAGFTIVTGGGPGIMEAANRGAYEANAQSIGLNIELPYEQRINDFVKKSMGFHYFFTRKVMLSFAAQSYVFFAGGFGTIDEFSEIVTLIQTHKITESIPVICVGKDYWQPFFDWIEKDVYGRYNAIDKSDMKIYQLVDSAEEALEIIKKSKARKDIV